MKFINWEQQDNFTTHSGTGVII